MTDAINANSDILGERELDAVPGGRNSEDRYRELENKQQFEAMRVFRQLLESC